MSALPVRREPSDVVPLCPWCNGGVDGATVGVADLIDAFDAADLWSVRLTPDGLPEGRPLVSACPTCAKPFAIQLRRHDCEVVFQGIRTRKDVEFARRQVGEVAP